MKAKIKIYKIKSSGADALRAWGKRLMGELVSEAVNSLKEENCMLEEAHLFSANGELYVLGLMVPMPGSTLQRGPDSEININHRKVLKDTILEEVSLEEIYRISNDAFPG